jgi:hypothetical protein
MTRTRWLAACAAALLLGGSAARAQCPSSAPSCDLPCAAQAPEATRAPYYNELPQMLFPPNALCPSSSPVVWARLFEAVAGSSCEQCEDVQPDAACGPCEHHRHASWKHRMACELLRFFRAFYEEGHYRAAAAIAGRAVQLDPSYATAEVVQHMASHPMVRSCCADDAEDCEASEAPRCGMCAGTAVATGACNGCCKSAARASCACGADCNCARDEPCACGADCCCKEARRQNVLRRRVQIISVPLLDHGTVQSNVSLHDYRYRVSAGFGIRMTVPMLGPVPIAIDFGFPIVRAQGDRTHRMGPAPMMCPACPFCPAFQAAVPPMFPPPVPGMMSPPVPPMVFPHPQMNVMTPPMMCPPGPCPTAQPWAPPMPAAQAERLPPPRVVNNPMQAMGLVSAPANEPTRGPLRISVSGKQVCLRCPGLEACCNNVTSLPDGRALLEGNVCLTFTREDRPAKIQAQRMIVDLEDGSWEISPARLEAQGVQPISYKDYPCRSEKKLLTSPLPVSCPEGCKPIYPAPCVPCPEER